MKKVRLSVRVSARRLDKIRAIAASREKTMTQMIEEWIDSLDEKPS